MKSFCGLFSFEFIGNNIINAMITFLVALENAKNFYFKYYFVCSVSLSKNCFWRTNLPKSNVAGGSLMRITRHTSKYRPKKRKMKQNLVLV